MFRKSGISKQHIRVEFDITRRKSSEDPPWHQHILYETDEINENVASALRRINEADAYSDMDGNPVGTIVWENSCLQKKCGACAMLIDGRPALACGTLLRSHKGKGPLTLEPLSKFPVIADLRVDRSILFDNLRIFGMWEDEKASMNEKKAAVAYEASRCLQCGCCLEVCPNFALGERFFGAAGFVPASRILASEPKENRERIRKAYMEHAYSGCGKSLACMDICPAGIDIEHLLTRSGAAVLYDL